jgi:hypothetical protein
MPRKTFEGEAMTRVKIITAILVASLLTACSTGYQSNNFWRLNGGYSETQLAEDTYIINFQANGYTRLEKASDLAMMRTAEIGLQKGFTYFTVIENDAGFKTSYDEPNYNCRAIGNNVSCSSSGGGTTKKPRISKTVKYYKFQPADNAGTVYETAFVFASIAKKYGLETTTSE